MDFSSTYPLSFFVFSFLSNIHLMWLNHLPFLQPYYLVDEIIFLWFKIHRLNDAFNSCMCGEMCNIGECSWAYMSCYSIFIQITFTQCFWESVVRMTASCVVSIMWHFSSQLQRKNMVHWNHHCFMSFIGEPVWCIILYLRLHSIVSFF